MDIERDASTSTVTEWEFFSNDHGWVRVPSEEAAFLNARYFHHRRVRSRTVTFGPWEEVTQ